MKIYEYKDLLVAGTGGRHASDDRRGWSITRLSQQAGYVVTPPLGNH